MSEADAATAIASCIGAICIINYFEKLGPKARSAISSIPMSTLITFTALILGVTGDIKYPAICKETYLSDKRVENVEKAEKALIRKPGCMRIGNEVITEGDRAGETYSIFTCCTPL